MGKLRHTTRVATNTRWARPRTSCIRSGERSGPQLTCPATERAERQQSFRVLANLPQQRCQCTCILQSSAVCSAVPCFWHVTLYVLVMRRCLAPILMWCSFAWQSSLTSCWRVSRSTHRGQPKGAQRRTQAGACRCMWRWRSRQWSTPPPPPPSAPFQDGSVQIWRLRPISVCCECQQ